MYFVYSVQFSILQSLFLLPTSKFENRNHKLFNCRTARNSRKSVKINENRKINSASEALDFSCLYIYIENIYIYI